MKSGRLMKAVSGLFFLVAALCAQTIVLNGQTYPIYNAKEYQIKGTPVVDENRKFYGDGENLLNLQWGHIVGTPTPAPTATATRTPTPTPTVSPSATPTPTPSPTPNDHVLTVGAQGCEFTSIQAAVDSISGNSASNRYTVLVHPGIYAEQVTMNKSYVSLVGIDKNTCIISRASTGVGGDIHTVYIGNDDTTNLSDIEIKNLSIKNTAEWGTGIAQEAIKIHYNSGLGTNTYTVKCKIYNCNFYGYQDTVFCYPNSDSYLESCYIDGGFDIFSVYNADIQVSNSRFYAHHESANLGIFYIKNDATRKSYIQGCYIDSINNAHTQSGIRIQDTTAISFIINNFFTSNIDQQIIFVGGTNPTTYVGGNYGYGTTQAGCVALTTNGISLVGGISATDIISVNQASSGKIKISGGVDGEQGLSGLELAGDGGAYDTNLYRADANALKTDDSFNAAGGFKCGNTTGVSSETITVVTDLQIATTGNDNNVLNKKTRSITITGGIITTVGAESDWTLVGEVEPAP